MTQVELIEACNLIHGDCKDCQVHIEMLCDKYQEKYRCTPFMEETKHPERYTKEEL